MIDHLPLKISVLSGNVAYGFIPVETLRHNVDKLFPYLSKCEIADSASGYLHRWREGHDLLVDIPSTLADKGFGEATHHAGHILFTDFPTKAGIPIPGFSQSGLGGMLKDLGISPGWMNVSLFDTGIGFFCVAEGCGDLYSAIAGNLEMSFETFVDTFGEGALEIALAVSAQNPILLAGGIGNIIAGLVSAWKTYTYYVDPVDFFGGAAGGAIVGGLLTLLFSKEPTLQGKMLQSLKNASKSAALGGLFTVKSFFGYGALLGMLAYQLGNMAAKKDCEKIAKTYSIDVKSFDCFLKTVCEGNQKFMDFWNSSFSCKTFDDSAENLKLNNKPQIYFENCDFLFDDSTTEVFDSSSKTLDDSPTELFDTSAKTFDGSDN